MWPWGHLAVGYLCYSTGVRLTEKRISTLAVIALAFGTQFPDLVDKPLAWTVQILPNGRSLAHSVLVASIVCIALYALARRIDTRSRWPSSILGAGREPGDQHSSATHVASGFVLGYATHLAMDAIYPLLWGDLSDLAFLGWPLLPPVQYDGETSFVAHFTSIETSPFFLLQIGLVGLALVLWHLDGRPGLN